MAVGVADLRDPGAVLPPGEDVVVLRVVVDHPPPQKRQCHARWTCGRPRSARGRCGRSCASCRAPARCGSCAARRLPPSPRSPRRWRVAASLAERSAAARMRNRKRIVDPARRPSFDGGSAAAAREMRTCVSRSISPKPHGLERDIERHHLRQGRRVQARIRVAGMEHLTRAGVHHHGGIRGRTRRRGKGNAEKDNQRRQRRHQNAWSSRNLLALPNGRRLKRL